MKKVLFAITASAFLISCGGPQQNDQKKGEENKSEKSAENKAEEGDEPSFPYYAGEEFDASKAVEPAEFLSKLSKFEGDSMRTTLRADINAACKKKGCWMKLDMPDRDDVMVRFKDYDFFVPLNSGGRKTTVHGVAYYDTISVAQLRHYAEDGGVDADSIAKINEPEITLAFLADGVLVE